MDRHAHAATEGIRRLEGYLLAHSEREAARRAAEDFAARLPGLGPEERAEVVRLYTAERMALSRRTLEHIAGRCGELRAEYTDRYELLRRRLLRRHVALLLLAAASGCALWWLKPG